MPLKKSLARSRGGRSANAVTIEDPHVIQLERDPGCYFPAIMYQGASPRVGQMVHFTARNGVKYAGEASDVSDTKEGVIIVFYEGLSPVN